MDKDNKKACRTYYPQFFIIIFRKFSKKLTFDMFFNITDVI